MESGNGGNGGNIGGRFGRDGMRFGLNGKGMEWNMVHDNSASSSSLCLNTKAIAHEADLHAVDHSELVSTFLFVSDPPILISVSPMLAFLSGSIVTRWSDERILSRSTGSPLKICSHSDMGTPLGAPGASLMYNLADLISLLNFRMRFADLTQLGFCDAS